jgi:hypothetical protein
MENDILILEFSPFDIHPGFLPVLTKGRGFLSRPGILQANFAGIPKPSTFSTRSEAL